MALSRNLRRECIVATIRGLPFRLEEAIARSVELSCSVAVCGVGNKPGARDRIAKGVAKGVAVYCDAPLLSAQKAGKYWPSAKLVDAFG